MSLSNPKLENLHYWTKIVKPHVHRFVQLPKLVQPSKSTYYHPHLSIILRNWTKDNNNNKIMKNIWNIFLVTSLLSAPHDLGKEWCISDNNAKNLRKFFSRANLWFSFEFTSIVVGICFQYTKQATKCMHVRRGKKLFCFLKYNVVVSSF